MKNKYSIFLVMFLLSRLACLYSQTKFQKTFGGTNNDGARSVLALPGGGYIIAGYSDSIGMGGTDANVVKTDLYGNYLWTKTYGGSGYEDCSQIITTSDSGYALIGLGSNGTLYLTKTDSLGSSLWSKSVSTTSSISSPSLYHRVSIFQTTDGGYIITASVGQSVCTYDIYVVKTDSQGNLSWSKTFNLTQTLGTCDEYGTGIQQTSDGGYIISGYHRYSAAYYPCLLRINSLGNIVWFKSYSGVQDGKIFSLQQTNDGGFILCGSTNSGNGGGDVLLIKSDSNGNPQWSKSYGGTGSDVGLSIQKTLNGEFIIAGITQNPNAATCLGGILLLSVNNSGTMLWKKTIGAYGDRGFSVQQSSDGGFILGGINSSISITGAYVIKTDNLGNSGCNECIPSGFGTMTQSLTVSTLWTGGTNSITTTLINTGGIASPVISSSTLCFSCIASTPTISVSGSTTFCQGGNVTLTSSSSSNYLWSNGGTNQSIAVSVSGNYFVTVTDGNGCTATSVSMNVTVNPLPTAIIIPSGTTTFCQGTLITLTATNGMSNYSWSTGASTSSIAVSTPGSFSVAVTNSNGCSATSSAISVIVNSLPTVSLILNPDTVCINTGAYALTGGTPSGGIYSGAGVSAGNFNPSVAGNGLHNIIYSYTDGNNCTNSDISQIFVDLCTDIQTISDNQSISIFPNPTNSTFKISFLREPTIIEVTNLFGEKIYSSKINSNKTEIDLTKQSQGIYFIKINSSNGIAIKKLIKE